MAEVVGANDVTPFALKWLTVNLLQMGRLGVQKQLIERGNVQPVKAAQMNAHTKRR